MGLGGEYGSQLTHNSLQDPKPDEAAGSSRTVQQRPAPLRRALNSTEAPERQHNVPLLAPLNHLPASEQRCLGAAQDPEGLQLRERVCDIQNAAGCFMALLPTRVGGTLGINSAGWGPGGWRGNMDSRKEQPSGGGR